MSTSEDQFFRKSMSKSKLEMPFSDFEDRMMIRIGKELSYKTSLVKSLNLSLLFFILGSGFGLMLAGLLSRPGDAIAGIPASQILFFFQLVFVILVIIQAEQLIKLFYKLKNL